MKLDYVGGAYLAFAVILAWDYLAPRVKLAQVRRMIALRVRRDAAKRNA
jgi:heme exporter protein D